jgi:hypothetical protein
MGGEWRTGLPEEAGLDAALLCSLNVALDNSPEMNVHAVLVIRGGKLVYETYRAGEDTRWSSKHVCAAVPSCSRPMAWGRRRLCGKPARAVCGVALAGALHAGWR